jgi:ubiquitin-protein ligase E3 C
MILKNFTGDVESELSLNFTVTDEGELDLLRLFACRANSLCLADFGISRTIDLIPGGSEIAVTNENRIQYIYLMSH